MTLQIELPPEQHDRLLRMAERLGVAPQELARVALADVVNGPDDQFNSMMERIIRKNTELFARLAH